MVKGLRARQGPARSKAQGGRSDPARSEPRGPNKAQRGQRPSEVRALRVCEEQTRTCVTARRPVCQQASVPPNPTFPCSVFTSRGRHVPAPAGGASGLSFFFLAPSFSSLFCRFSVLVSREVSRSRGCAVATPAIRGVSRSG